MLHRDLKPANVMLGKFGETLVIDWGLAKRLRKTSDSLLINDDGSQESMLHPAIAETHGQSIVGRDVLGSLQYMSPEQANARHDELGPATDVFSLGAILFHILTGRAPIGADLTTHELDQLRKNRTAHDLALHKRASQGTFPAPRQLRSDVPAALEAVCLKAMSFRPDARYESAQLLAKDIELWLADEPVSVWREPFSVRAQRWMKQHRTAVATTAAMFLMGFLGLIGWSALSAKHAREVNSANIKLRDTNTALRTANEQEQAATAIAREQSQLALKSLQSVIFEIQRELVNIPGTGELRRNLLKTAIARLQDVSERFTSRSAIDHNTSAALTDLGDVYLRIGALSPDNAGTEGPLAAARRVYQQAHEIDQKRAAAAPTDSQAKRALWVSYSKLGDVSLQAGQVEEAIVYYQKALEISQNLAVAAPTNAEAQRDLAVSHNRLGDVNLRIGQMQEALGHYQKGLEIDQKFAATSPANAQPQRDQSVSHERLGDMSLQAGQLQEALTYYQKLLVITQKLALAAPMDAEAQRVLSVAYQKLGDVSLLATQTQEAIGYYQKGMEIFQKLAAANPTDAQAQYDLSFSYGRLGDVCCQAGQFQDAIGHYQKFLEITQKLAVADPTDAQAQLALSISYEKLGDVSLQAGQVHVALGNYHKGLAIRQDIAAAAPTDAQAQRYLMGSHYKLGEMELDQFQFPVARAHYQRGLTVLDTFTQKTKLKTFENEIAGLKRLIAVCDLSDRVIFDLDFAEAQDKAVVPQLLRTRLKRLVAYADSASEDVPAAVREKWSTGNLPTELLHQASLTANKLRKLEPATPKNFFNAGCCFGLILKSLVKLEVPEKDRLKAELQTSAIDSLKAAIAAGYKDAEHMSKDADLEPLRELPEFQALVKQLKR